MFLSACIPNYNHARYLPEALGALLAQERPPDEIIVLDDASTDDSVEVLRRFANEHPILRVERNEENLGVVRSLRRLTELASGEVLYYGASDDRVLPGLFGRSLEMLEKHPRAGFSCGVSGQVAADGSDLGLFPSPIVATEPVYLPPERIRALLPHGRDGWFVLGNTALWRRDAVIEVGGFRSELGSFADGFATMAIALRRGVCFIPQVLAEWRRLDTGYSASSSADPAAQRRLTEETLRLMQTEFADLFPPGYPESWRRRVAVDDALSELLARRTANGREAGIRDYLLRAELLATELWLQRRTGLPIRQVFTARVDRRRQARRLATFQAAGGGAST